MSYRTFITWNLLGGILISMICAAATPAHAAVVAYYDFDPNSVSSSGGTTTVANLGNAGSALNGYWLSASDAPTIVAAAIGTSGVTGNVIDFAPASGSDATSYLEIDGMNAFIPSFSYTGATAWTFTEWIKTATNGETGGTFFSNGNTALSGSWSNRTGNSYYYLHNSTNSAGAYVGGVRNAGGNWGSSAAVNNATWHMITVEYAGNGGSSGADPIVYVDGGANVFQNYNMAPSQAGAGTVVRVGWAGPGENGSTNFSGLMANVGFWNQGLTQDEAASLYNLSFSTLAAINQYGDVQMSQLFAIAEGSSASATIASNRTTINWAPSTAGTAALAALGGAQGQEWASGGNYYAWLESSTSSGMYFAVVGTLGVANSATNYVWSGSADGTWENAANWSLGGSASSTVPDSVGLTATFGTAGASSTAVLNASHTISGLTFLGTVGTTVSGTGTLTLSATGGGASVSSAGTNAISAPLTLAVATSANVAFGAQLTLAGPISGSGALLATGNGRLLLTGSNTYSGPTTIDQGELVVNGSLASAVAIQSGGTLGGTGSVGSVTVSPSGCLAPGDAPGALTVSGSLILSFGAKLSYELGTPADSDEIFMPAGLLTLNGQQFSDFTFTPLGGFGPGMYDLIDASSIAGSLAPSGTSGFVNGYPADIAVDGNEVVLNVVPEPGTLGLFLVAALAACAPRTLRLRPNL